MQLSQEEADTLRMIEKYLTTPELVKLPPPVGTALHPVHYHREGHRMDNMKISTYHARITMRESTPIRYPVACFTTAM